MNHVQRSLFWFCTVCDGPFICSFYFQTHLMNAVRFEGIDQVQVALQDLQADPNKVDEVRLTCIRNLTRVVIYRHETTINFTI